MSMTDSVFKLIQKAEYLLKKQPYDVAHDLSHHQRVWETARNIAQEEQLNVDFNALKVACYWHDVVLEEKNETENRQLHIDETLNYLITLMQEEKCSETFQKTVHDAILDHGFEKKRQLNTEGEVLFDADKLDALNPERYSKLLIQLKNKQLSKIKLFMYKQAAKVWLRTMRNRYHFEVSKKLHDQKMLKMLKDTELVAAAKEIGIDIHKLVG